MQPLAATDSILAVAGSATSITSTVSGDEITIATGADAFKVFDQRQLPITTPATLYTPGTGKSGLIKMWALKNTSGGAVTVTLYVNGSGVGNQIDSFSIPAGGKASLVNGGFVIQDANGAVVTTTTLAGDVSGPASSNVIGNGVVSNAKLANMANNTIKGNNTGGTSAPVDLTAAQTKTLLAIVPADVSGFDTQVRTSRLDQMTAPTGDLSLNSQKITNLAQGVSGTDGVNVTQLNNAVTGLLDYRGTYNASTNLFPAAGGSGTAGAVLKGDFWICSVGGTLGTTTVTPGDLIIALVDTPAQTAANWDVVEHDLGYAPEDSANKSNVTTLGTSTVLYPTQNAAKVYSDSKVENSITSGHTTVAPSGDAVFTALAAKAADSLVVHNTGNENVGGIKTFTSAPVVPTASFPESAVASLVSDLAAKAADSAVVHNTGNENVGGVKTFTSAPVVPTNSFPESAISGLITDLAGKQPLDSDLTTIAALAPNAGQHMVYSPSGWIGATTEYDVTTFGADPTGGGDSTLGFYNAIISCMIIARVQVTAQTTTGSTFTLPVQANILASTGTLHAMTTTGLIGFTYTGGGSTSLSCTVTYGVTGGLILNNSLVGVNNSIVNGGIVNIPAGFYVTSYPIINSIPGIWFKGAGGSTTHDVGPWPSAGGSFISQRGAVQGLDVLVNMPISGTAGVQGGQALGGIRVTGLSADCTNANGYMWCRSGFVMLSTTGEYMEDLFVYNASLTAYRFSTLGASMLSEAADQTRGTHINLRFRQLEGKSTAANISGSGLTNPAAVTNLNALAASTVTVSGAPNANWDTSGLAKFQAIDQLTGNVCWYLVAYTGISGSTLTGCTAIAQLPNETNSTTLNAATPASGNFKPNALMFAGSRIVPAQGAFGDGITWHGSATANACCGLWMTLVGTYFMGGALVSTNSDSQKIINPVFNRTTAGTPTGIGVELHGSTFAGASGASGSTRNQYFIGGDPGLGGINVRGTDTLGYLQPASTNKWDYYELGNGAPVPISGTNAHFIWTANGGLAVGSQAVSAAAQATAASFTGFITGTTIVVPPQGIQIGTTFRWVIPVIKTLAGTTYTVQVRWGTTNTFAGDTVAIASQALTGTAVVDTGQIEITMTVVGPLGATAAALAQLRLTHNLAATGLSTTGTAGSLQAAMTMATFASTSTNPGPAFLNVAISANAANVFTFNAPVTAEVTRAANP